VVNCDISALAVIRAGVKVIQLCSVAHRDAGTFPASERLSVIGLFRSAYLYVTGSGP